MAPAKAPLSPIRRFLLTQIAAGNPDIANATAAEFKISRQAANRHLRWLVERGLIRAQGRTRGRHYELVLLVEERPLIPVTAELDEHDVWSERILPHLTDIAENVRHVCHYGFTEMVNNVKDHSGSPTLGIGLLVTALNIDLQVADFGIGIFRKIREGHSLESEREAILELVKGKLTTDPEHHTGEGVFFTSRVFDEFTITSGQLFLIHSRDADDWLMEDQRDPVSGTLVTMRIAIDSKQTLMEVFERYASEQDDYAFRKTHVVVDLARGPGEALVSRSQAKRLLYRLDRFREVTLSFKNVDMIGPAFADEVFRVFRNQHPGIRLTQIHANEQIQRMIRRAEAALPPES